MKKIIVLALLSITLIQQTGLFRYSSAESLLVTFYNGGFETDPTTSSSGWVWPASDWVWDDSVANSGTHSAKISRGGVNATTSVWSTNLPVQPSAVYTLTYWLKTQNATFWPSVSIYQFTPGQVQTGPRLIAHANIPSGTTNWNQVTYRFQTMPNAATIQVRMYLPIAFGTFWFDDFSLEFNSTAIYAYQPGFPVLASGSVFYSSPVVVDLNNDAGKELLIAGGSYVDGWNPEGNPLPNFPLNTGDKHIQSQIAVGDLDGDSNLELAVGTKTPIFGGQGRVFVWNKSGDVLSGWPQTVAWNTQYANNESLVGTVVFADINNDHQLEILAGSSNNTAGYSGDNPPPSHNLYAWHANGSLVDGEWPTWHNTAGIYGFISAGDLDGNGTEDVEVGRDHHFLNTYNSSGISLTGWPIETYLYRNSGRYDIDEHIDYSHGAPVIADLDWDGEMEFIVSGFVGGPGVFPLNNSALLVLEPDGTRRHGWETPALGNGILNLYDRSTEAPAIADIDNDSQLEIIITTNDGWIRAYNPDKTILWAVNFTQGSILVATEPVIGDIDGDGNQEILFGTRVPSREEGIFYNGPVGLWALKADGSVIPGFPLPIPTPGMFGAPTLADLDNDGKLEILVTAREGEVIVWGTSTDYNPSKLPWPTSRHDLRRSATYSELMPLESSHIIIIPSFVNHGNDARITIFINSKERLSEVISMTNNIPSGLSYVPGTLTATSGIASEDGGIIRWDGYLSDSLSAQITYNVIVTTQDPDIIHNTAIIETATSGPITRSADIRVNYYFTRLPILVR